MCPRPAFVVLSHAALGCVCSEAPHLCVRLDVQMCSPWLPLPTCVIYSLVCWPSSEGTFSWPDLLSDPSIMGSTLQRLARGRMGHMLSPEEDGLSLVSPSSPTKYFSASGEPGWGAWYPPVLPKKFQGLGWEEPMPSPTHSAPSR